MKKIIQLKVLLFIPIFFLMLNCGSAGGGGGSSSSTAPKTIFNRWTSTSMSLVIDLTGGQFNTQLILSTSVPINQSWINALNAAGRSTSGLVAGQIFNCTFDFYIVGNETAGSISLNHDNIDTPEHNACLEWDSNCIIGACNIPADHLYSIQNDILTIRYFGGSTAYIAGVFR